MNRRPARGCMSPHTKHCAFSGRIVILGFGPIGPGTLPLILGHPPAGPSGVPIVAAEVRGGEEAGPLGVGFLIEPLTRENYRAVLDTLLGAGDFLLNVSIDVSSVALIGYCRE